MVRACRRPLYAAGIAAVLFLAACGPKEGSPEWCQEIKQKPVGQISMQDQQTYAEKCLAADIDKALGQETGKTK